MAPPGLGTQAGGASRLVALYRTVLKAHRRHLPLDMRLVGDMYVRDEFRTFRAFEKPSEGQAGAFFDEWERYVETVRGSPDARPAAITEEEVAAMSDEQRDMLRKLKRETHEYVEAINKRVGKDPEDKAP